MNQILKKIEARLSEDAYGEVEKKRALDTAKRIR